MSAAPVISEVGHIAIRVPDLAASEEFAVQVMGLTATERSDDSVWLSLDEQHHCIQYIRSDAPAVDHVGLVARDADALGEVRRRVEEGGHRIVSSEPLSSGPSDGFAFEAPGGFVLEIYTAMTKVERALPSVGVRPRRFGHANFFVEDRAAMESLFLDLLDFRVSDRTDGGAFLRCNVDHHGIGVFQGSGRLHHYAVEVPTMIEVGQFADLIDARGDSVLWGPMRHGMGRNVATYFQEPSGLVVEYYSDMERIYDDVGHVPGQWPQDGHKWYSLWGPEPLPEGFSELGVAPYDRSVRA